MAEGIYPIILLYIYGGLTILNLTYLIFYNNNICIYIIIILASIGLSWFVSYARNYNKPTTRLC